LNQLLKPYFTLIFLSQKTPPPPGNFKPFWGGGGGGGWGEYGYFLDLHISIKNYSALHVLFEGWSFLLLLRTPNPVYNLRTKKKYFFLIHSYGMCTKE